MSLPKEAPDAKAGWVSWGYAISDYAYLTEPQMRAFEVLMRDAPKTSTKKARIGRGIYICDHEVVLDSRVAPILGRIGLLAYKPIDEVVATRRGNTAWRRRRPSR